MADNIFVNDLQGFGKSFKDKGEQWLKSKKIALKSWARMGAKDKLIEEAKEHGVDVSDSMNAEEIKNKILEKIHM
jgi:2-phosphoglycerate kinase